MDTNFQTANEKSPFTALSDQGMNRIYEENGRSTNYMDQLKEDSDEDLGPETDIDAVDDVLVSPTKCRNPFANDLWKKGADDCENAHDLIDYGKQENLNMDRDVSFSDNNKFMNDNHSENESVEELAVSEPLDNVHMNQINSSYLTEMDTAMSDSQNIKFSSYSPVNNEFIEDIKFDNDNEKSVNSELQDHSFKVEKEKETEKDFVNDSSDFEKFQNNIPKDSAGFSSGEGELGQGDFLCNGNAENHEDDKIDTEKPVPVFNEEISPICDEKVNVIGVEDTMEAAPQINISIADSTTSKTNLEITEKSVDGENLTTVITELKCETPVSPDSTLYPPQVLSDSENISQKEVDIETPELLSPSIPPQDENLKDDITESGGEVDSEDDEWDYIKVGSGEPANERIEPVALSPLVAETDKSMMNSPLNPHAAEFVPVASISNPTEPEEQKTPLRSVPPSVNDIIASSPNWNTMDSVDVPDEVSFFKEIKTRPSNIFTENDIPSNDSDGLGCTQINLDGKGEEQEVNQSSGVEESPASEKFKTEMESPLATQEMAPHGIELATDMTSSFIVTSIMSTDSELSKQMSEMNFQEKDEIKPETFSTLNAEAAEFKSELTGFTSEVCNKLPDLLSSFPVAEEKIESQIAAPAEVSLLDSNCPEFTQPITPVEDTKLVDDIQSPPVQPEEVQKAEVETPEKLVAADLLTPEPVAQVVESPATPEPVVKSVEPSPVVETAAVATAATVAATAVATAVTQKKEEPKKSSPAPKTTSATPKLTKTATTPKTPTSAAKASPTTRKPTTPLASKTPTSKPVNTSASSPASAKPLAPKASTTTTRPATRVSTTPSTTAPRPLTRKTTSTTSTTMKTTTTTAAARPTSSRTAAPTKTTAAPSVTSTVSAPKPKPRVPSAPIEKKPARTTDAAKRPDVLTKRPGLASSTVTTTTRTITSRPASAPMKSAVKTTTTVTTTRTIAAKPRTSSTGVTTTTTTTTTRTLLNSKKPLNSTSTGSKPLSKTVVSKVNGLANGNASKTMKATVTSTTTTTKTKIENKTETKAENILGPSGDIIPNENENAIIDINKEVNLINGIGHD